MVAIQTRFIHVGVCAIWITLQIMNVLICVQLKQKQLLNQPSGTLWVVIGSVRK